MKKSLLVSLILLSGVFLTACGKNEENLVEENQSTDTTYTHDKIGFRFHIAFFTSSLQLYS